MALECDVLDESGHVRGLEYRRDVGGFFSLDFLPSLRFLSPSTRTFCIWIETPSILRPAKIPQLRRAGPPMSGRHHRQLHRNLPPPMRRHTPLWQVKVTARRASILPVRKTQCLNNQRQTRFALSPSRSRPLRIRRLRCRPRPRRPVLLRSSGRSHRPRRIFSRRPLRPTLLARATAFPSAGSQTRHPQCSPTDHSLSVQVGNVGGWRQVFLS